MTLHHYIGANIELPTGSFGRIPASKPISELVNVDNQWKKDIDMEFITVYETEEDASGIDVLDLLSGYESVRDKFTTPFVYEVQGYLHTNSTAVYRKALKSLFRYIDDHLFEGDFIEVYSCWDGEEDKEKDDRKDVVINLRTLQFGKHLKLKDLQHLSETFYLEDKQYVVVKK